MLVLVMMIIFVIIVGAKDPSSFYECFNEGLTYGTIWMVKLDKAGVGRIRNESWNYAISVAAYTGEVWFEFLDGIGHRSFIVQAFPHNCRKLT